MRRIDPLLMWGTQRVPAQPRVPNGVCRLYSTFSSVAVPGGLRRGCAAVGMLPCTDPAPAAGGGRAWAAVLGLPGTQQGGWEGSCAATQEGDWEPLSQLPPSPWLPEVRGRCPVPPGLGRVFIWGC